MEVGGGDNAAELYRFPTHNSAPYNQIYKHAAMTSLCICAEHKLGTEGFPVNEGNRLWNGPLIPAQCLTASGPQYYLQAKAEIRGPICSCRSVTLKSSQP